MGEVEEKNNVKNLLGSYLPLLSGILSFIIYTPILMNDLSKTEFGIYLLILSFMSYFSLCNFGLPQTIVRLLSSGKDQLFLSDEEKKVVSTSLFFFVAVATFISIISIISFTFIGINESYLNPLYFFIILISKLIFDVFDSVQKSKNNYYIGKFLIAFGVVISGLMSVFAVKMGYELEGIVICYVITNIFNVIFLTMYSKKNVNFIFEYRKVDILILKDMLPSSFWYFAGSLGAIVIFQLDAVTIAYVLGAASVAIYGVLFRIADILRQAISSLSDIMFTRIAEGILSNDDIWKKHNTLLMVTLVLSIGLSLIMYFKGFDFVRYWMGIEEELDPILTIGICFYLIAFTSNHVTGVFLGALNLHKKAVIVAYIQSIINVTLTILVLEYTQNEYWAIVMSVIALLATNTWYNVLLLYRNVK